MLQLRLDLSPDWRWELWCEVVLVVTSLAVGDCVSCGSAVEAPCVDEFSFGLTLSLLGNPVALKWSDFSGGRLTVRRSLVESEGRLIERRTKTGTKGHRTIAVDSDTLEAVEALRVRQWAAADEYELPEPVYVFSFDAGVSPWRPDHLSLAFGRLSRREFRLHDLRHYHATQLIAAGVTVTTVSKYLSHTSTSRDVDEFVSGHAYDDPPPTSRITSRLGGSSDISWEAWPVRP